MLIHGCDLSELAVCMGENVTDTEARFMRQRLTDLRYFETDSVPEMVWLDICRQAADFARHRYGARS